MGTSPESQPYRVLAYGIERKGIPAPEPIKSRRYTIEFGPLHEAPRFQNFDGVIVFQGSFETFERIPGSYKSYWKHQWDRDELDKRHKEAVALIDGGGFLCLLLSDDLIASDDGRDFRGTDLSKRLLYGFADPESIGTRLPIVKSKVNELSRFFSDYGAAWVSLSGWSGYRGTKLLATAGGYPVSVVADGRVFAIPTLIPTATPETVEEYFTTLVDGLVALWERLKEDLPEWADEYRFPDEDAMLARKLEFTNAVSDIERKLQELRRLKRVLAAQGEALVDAVMEVFEKALPLKPKREEAFREDPALVDSAGKTVALAEVKGVSRGVAREHVNQADSHRERSGLPSEFPSLLIVNVNIKNAGSIADKDQLVAPEQVQHAARNNILVLRTLDLLNLASLHLGGKLTDEAVVTLLTTSKGWLRVGETAEVLAD